MAQHVLDNWKTYLSEDDFEYMINYVENCKHNCPNNKLIMLLGNGGANGKSTLISEILAMKMLIEYLSKFHPSYLEFEPTSALEVDITKYITLDVWWEQFEELKNLLKKQYEKILQWEEEANYRDTMEN